MKTNTVRIDSAFFLTPQGEIALDNYEKWKANNGGDSDEIKVRRQKLLKSGLVKTGPIKIKRDGGLVKLVCDVLEGADKKLPALVEGCNKVLKDEGDSTVTEKQITCCLSMQLLENKRISNTEARVTVDKHGTYSLNTDYEEIKVLKEKVTGKKGKVTA